MDGEEERWFVVSILEDLPSSYVEQMVGGEARRLRGLVNVAQVINSSLELNSVLGHVLDHGTRMLEAESGSIMLVDPERGELRVVAAQGPRAEAIMGRTQSIGSGIAGWVATHRRPVLLHGAASDARFKRVCDRLDIRDAMCAPLLADSELLGVVSLSNRANDIPFADEDLELLVAISNQAALAIRNATSFQEMRRQRQTVERLITEVTRAQEQERARIALQLHDGPAQTMYAALRNLEAILAMMPQAPAGTEPAFKDLEHTIRAAIDETRSVMVDLRPLVLDDMGLFAALRQYLKQFEQRTGIRTTLVRRGEDRRLPPQMESYLYRITQESLTNIWKHAGARNARVVLDVQPHSCALEVSDDGIGINLEEAASKADTHLGMTSLRDRAELAGGRLAVTSAPGQGTTLRITAPLAS